MCLRKDFQICDAILESPAQDAVFAPSLRVEGSLFLGNSPYSNGVTSLVVTGAFFFASLRVDDDVFITNCAISPRSNHASEAVFQASEEHGQDITLSFAGAHAARLHDEPAAPSG